MTNGVSGGSIGEIFSARVQALVRQVSRPSESAVRYTPPDLQVRFHPAEMNIDMTQVWEDIGVLRPSSFLHELKNKAEQAYSAGIIDEVHNGRRIRDIHKEPGNVYGRIEFAKFMRNANKQVVLAGAPKQPAKIDIRIYPPEIHFNIKPLIIGVPKEK
jgi:hypothetical protein